MNSPDTPRSPDEESLAFFNRLLTAPSVERSRLLSGVIAVYAGIMRDEKKARVQLARQLASSLTHQGASSPLEYRSIARMILNVEQGKIPACSCPPPVPQGASVFGDAVQSSLRTSRRP